jgi:hypothetical protein
VAITSLANDDLVRALSVREDPHRHCRSHLDDRAGTEGCPAGQRTGRANGSTRLRLGPAIRDLYEAAADAGLNDDDTALSHGCTAECSRRHGRPSRTRPGSRAHDPDRRLPTRPFVSTLPPIMFIMLSYIQILER